MTIRDRIQADLLAAPLLPDRILISVPAYRALLLCSGLGGVHRIIREHKRLGALLLFGVPAWVSDDIEGETYRMVYRKAKRKA